MHMQKTRNKRVPSILAPNFNLATEAIRERTTRTLEALSNGRMVAELIEFSHDGCAIPIMAGANGNKKQWCRGDWALRIRMRHVGPCELGAIKLIFYPAEVINFLVQSYSANRVSLDLHVSARVKEQ